MHTYRDAYKNLHGQIHMLIDTINTCSALSGNPHRMVSDYIAASKYVEAGSIETPHYTVPATYHNGWLASHFDDAVGYTLERQVDLNEDDIEAYSLWVLYTFY